MLYVHICTYITCVCIYFFWLRWKNLSQPYKLFPALGIFHLILLLPETSVSRSLKSCLYFVLLLGSNITQWAFILNLLTLCNHCSHSVSYFLITLLYFLYNYFSLKCSCSFIYLNINWKSFRIFFFVVVLLRTLLEDKTQEVEADRPECIVHIERIQSHKFVTWFNLD